MPAARRAGPKQRCALQTAVGGTTGLQGHRYQSVQGAGALRAPGQKTHLGQRTDPGQDTHGPLKNRMLSSFPHRQPTEAYVPLSATETLLTLQRQSDSVGMGQVLHILSLGLNTLNCVVFNLTMADLILSTLNCLLSTLVFLTTHCNIQCSEN